jgi:hypothetical protein
MEREVELKMEIGGGERRVCELISTGAGAGEGVMRGAGGNAETDTNQGYSIHDSRRTTTSPSSSYTCTVHMCFQLMYRLECADC